MKKGREEGIKIGFEKGEEVGVKKGKKEGEKVGIKKGEERGLKKGQEIGKKVGHFENAIQMAKAMKKKGIDVKVIAEVSKLSIKQIQKL